ncbi:GGDEF domain-containing protein [Sphingomonas solaris]|uniref:diguanylate cyclase n=1 Tax=Alterirhizorhabdus solaris TaxID=2529389 RepID=A0A558RCJ3_9SPHN|nr:GGDEF domain-containing protein [Sphingomonas solaris]TVV76962.1 diguanylate cyclase [Sphingomonas solaris]
MLKVGQVSGEDALAFLARQRLPPTPQNYTLAYIAISQPRSPIGRAVNAITDGGIRIRQEEANEIVGLYAGGSPRTDQVEDDPGHDALRHQAIKLGEVASSAAAATGEFTRDLSAEAEALDEGAVRTVQIVTRMIERSKRAEDDLNAAVREVDSLRQQLEAARDDAERDQLTGLGNRRSIERHLRQIAERGVSRVIGICDVDRFKSINDRYGHGVGDRVLKMVASSLKSSCEPHFVGRWGGEEFLLIVAGDDPSIGITLLDKAREDLAIRDFKLRETDEPLGTITFSAGVAVATGNHAASVAAIHRADACLYRAKAEGRNMVLGEERPPVIVATL